MNPTFADFLTPAGLVVAAGVVTGFVQLVKTTFPIIDARVSGAVMAFSLSCLLYVVTAAATGISTPDQALAVILSWLGCATAAVGIKATADHVTAVKGTTA